MTDEQLLNIERKAEWAAELTESDFADDPSGCSDTTRAYYETIPPDIALDLIDKLRRYELALKIIAWDEHPCIHAIQGTANRALEPESRG